MKMLDIYNLFSRGTRPCDSYLIGQSQETTSNLKPWKEIGRRGHGTALVLRVFCILKQTTFIFEDRCESVIGKFTRVRGVAILTRLITVSAKLRTERRPGPGASCSGATAVTDPRRPATSISVTLTPTSSESLGSAPPAVAADAETASEDSALSRRRLVISSWSPLGLVYARTGQEVYLGVPSSTVIFFVITCFRIYLRIALSAK